MISERKLQVGKTWRNKKGFCRTIISVDADEISFCVGKTDWVKDATPAQFLSWINRTHAKQVTP